MARSLEIEKDKEKIDIKIDGTGNSPINIGVTVDGDTTNSSFTVSAFNDYWFTYSIDRNNSNVYVVVKIKKNLTTRERYGSITLTHNCANISKTIEIFQKAVEYEVKNNTTHYHSFKSVPQDSKGNLQKYEEFTVNLEALNGRGRWYVKDIKQYQVSQNDSFDDSKYDDEIAQDNAMIQTQTSYDNVFDYTINGNYLTVRSYGQIDLTNAIKATKGKPHMRYFFIISHSDVNNLNKLPMDEKAAYQEQSKRYEDKILFVFDGSTGSSYSEDDNPAIPSVTPPSETIRYTFLVNGSANQQILNFAAEESENTLSVTSIKTSSEGTSDVNYSVVNTTDWCLISDNKLTVYENTTNNSRQGTLTFKQNTSNKEIKVIVAQEGVAKTYIFTLDGKTENKTIEYEKVNTATIISTYGGDATPYTIVDTSATKWISYKVNNDGVYTFEAKDNPSYSSRQTTLVFTQKNSNKTLSLTITQSGKEVKNEFEAYFDIKDGEKIIELEVDENSRTQPITVISTSKGAFKEFKFNGITYYDAENDKWVKDDNGWVTYNALSGNDVSIAIQEYSYGTERNYNDGKDKKYSTTAKLTFERDDLTEGNIVYLTLTQTKQGGDMTIKTDDILSVGYEEGYYSEPYGKLYSYATINGEAQPVSISDFIVTKGDDFIVANQIQLSDAIESEDGYYYKVTIGVKKNELEEVRTGEIKFTNIYGGECTMTVEQRKNGEVVLTAFDYIVMNYEWTDYVDDSGNIYSRDFDSVMYFDTEAIGDMYQKCVNFGDKIVSDKNASGDDVTYGELAFDQVTSKIGDIDRIETQVVYLLRLKDDGYLQKIKEADERYLIIQLYGNLYNVTNAKATPEGKRTTNLSVHTYLGGTMSKDNDKKTMVNEGGEEVNVGAIKDVTYNITAINNIKGDTVETVTSIFQHLGTLQYNVRDKTAVFTPVNN